MKSIDKASNGLSKRHRPNTTATRADTSDTKKGSLLTSRQSRQREIRHERLRKERQRDNLLMVATIFVFILVVAFSVILYHVWKSQGQPTFGLNYYYANNTTIKTNHDANNQKSNPKQKVPPPSRRQSSPQSSPESRNKEKERITRLLKELETLDQAIVGDKISRSDILLNPDLLLFRNGTINERHWKGKSSDDKPVDSSDGEFFKLSRLFDTFPWEQDEDMSNRKIYKDANSDPYTGKPYMDYTNPLLYIYPSFRTIEESKQGYPRLSTLQEIFSAWPQDEIDRPRPALEPIRETLQHFDYTNADELYEAWNFMDQQLPFKLTNVTELLEANLKWTDAYVAEQFQSRSAKGNCQESPTSFFAFYDRRKWEVATMGLPPTRDNDFGFRRWAKHARFADHERIPSRRPHFYWQAGVPKEERYQPKDTWSFLSLDLPSFSATEPNTTILCPDPAQSKGIQCRFGERGVTAANHFDGGQNMVGMITGAKRYILSPPNQCSKLGIHTERGTALYRHSLLNLERLPFSDSSSVTSDLEREWLEQAKSAQAVETVLKAGEVLFIPSHWFHYIISLQKNAQCNVRSGIHVEGNDQFGGQYHVSAEGCQ
ncbi:unnamed protein product [Cylindrotheca closterium]|uniref:JmjC domain-containing protein n=1 Tax=Cylindrotheca closterium TaxID=2856 RepID=A0AAD2JJA4_9STRA|nr:unnamed protein product [Cylindrotheca closterium]